MTLSQGDFLHSYRFILSSQDLDESGSESDQRLVMETHHTPSEGLEEDTAEEMEPTVVYYSAVT